MDLLPRIHIAPTGDLPALEAEIDGLALDPADPGGHASLLAMGREMNKRQSLGTGGAELYYGEVRAGMWPAVASVGGMSKAGLLGWWALDEFLGNFFDSHSTSNHMSVYGSPTYSGAGAGANTGTSVRFGASNFGKVDTPLSAGPPHTLVGWGRAATGKYSVPLSIADAQDANRYWSIEVVPDYAGQNYFKYYFRWDSNQGIQVGSPLVDTWYHLVGVSRAADDHELFVNGQSVGTSDTDVDISGLDNTAIGSVQRSSPYYGDGDVDQVSLWSRALTAEEVAWLYNGGAGRAYSELA